MEHIKGPLLKMSMLGLIKHEKAMHAKKKNPVYIHRISYLSDLCLPCLESKMDVSERSVYDIELDVILS